MPASPCRTYTRPNEKSAWESLNSAERNLESILLNTGLTAEVNGMAYFIAEDGRLRCAPMFKDGSIDKEQAMHRNDYEGLSTEEMMAIKEGIIEWLYLLPNADPYTAENYAQLLQRDGFEVISTGGALTAWSRTLPTGYYVLVTNDSRGHTFNSRTDTVIVAAYNSDNEAVRPEWKGPLSRARTAIALQGNVAIELALISLNKTKLIEDALNAAVKTIQNHLGVKAGNRAEAFFAGTAKELVRAPLRRYIDFELEMIRPDYEEPVESERHGPRG